MFFVDANSIILYSIHVCEYSKRCPAFDFEPVMNLILLIFLRKVLHRNTLPRFQKNMDTCNTQPPLYMNRDSSDW